MEIAGPDGSITVNKFNVYKEKDEQRPDFGKYKFYVQVGDTNMSAVASRQDLNAYFDRVATPNQLIEKNFGERLHLKSAYEKYQLPERRDRLPGMKSPLMTVIRFSRPRRPQGNRLRPNI